MLETLTLKQYTDLNHYVPIVIPAALLRVIEQHYGIETVSALKAGLVVKIENFWCMYVEPLKAVSKQQRINPDWNANRESKRFYKKLCKHENIRNK